MFYKFFLQISKSIDLILYLYSILIIFSSYPQNLQFFICQLINYKSQLHFLQIKIQSIFSFCLYLVREYTIQKKDFYFKANNYNFKCDFHIELHKICRKLLINKYNYHKIGTLTRHILIISP